MAEEKLRPLEIGYGDDKFIFHWRMISLSESDEIESRLADINDKDPERHQLQFDLFKEILSKFSVDVPQRVTKENGERVLIPLESVHAEFGERTPKNERIIRAAYNLFQNSMQPDFRFLSHSG